MNNASQTSADFVNGVQALASALVSACADPADAVRLAAELADFMPNAATPVSLVGVAMAQIQIAVGAVCRRSAVIALARASTLYEPASYDDAVATRQIVCALLDVEITIAGDTGADASYQALRLLRGAVVADFTARGAALAQIKVFNMPRPMPALALSHRIYNDTDRSDELVIHANPRHPLFMPLQFKALAE